MAEFIPQWAAERALALAKEYGQDQSWWAAHNAFAHYISEHEEAPVDPLLALMTDAYDAVWEGQDFGMSRDEIVRGLADELRDRVKVMEAQS